MDTALDVTEVDPRDDDAFARWYDVVDAARPRPDEREWFPQELREGALAGRPSPDGSSAVPDELRLLLLARRDGRPVGAAVVELPQADNRHLAWLGVHVPPAERRRGVGRALLEAATEIARAHGRSVLGGDVDEPPQEGGRAPGRAFALANGFEQALVEVRRDLALPVPADRLDALQAQAEAVAAGYRTVVVRDAWPDDLLEERADLGRRMSIDVPLGTLDWTEERWDGARVRRQEALFRRQGRRLLGAGAVHEADGRLVAFTELVVPPGPQRVWQYDTLVVPEHRGRRLGLLVKVAALRLLQETEPRARVVTTLNADSNRHMIAVNEALGFVSNGVWVDWQRALERAGG